DYFRALEDFARGADVLVTDCSMPDDEKMEGHMTPTESARLAEKAGVEKLVLSHLYPDIEGHDIVEKARETFL
ncbi:MAG: MBL fold metallo-hydrolase, partial [Candidatus Nanohaloarchaea archaeon]